MTYDAGRIRHDAVLMHYSRSSNGTSAPSNASLRATGDSGLVFTPNDAATISYASNSNDVGNPGAAGASTLVSRADHVHRGVTSISHTSNTMYGGITLVAESGIGITSSQPGTINIRSTGGGSSSGGTSFTQAYVGNNGVYTSNLTMASQAVYMTKVTLASDCLVTNIEAHVKNPGGDLVTTLAVALYSDSGGSPLRILASSPAGDAQIDLLLESAASTPVYRWFGRAIGYWAVAGDYWLAVMSKGNPTTMAYDIGSGSDRTYVSGGQWFADAGFYTVTTGTNKHSIRANTIR